MVGKSVEKLLRKLRSKKYRWEHSLFIAEGPKVVKDLLRSGVEARVVLTSDPKLAEELDSILIGEKELRTYSQLETANDILGIFHFPDFPDHEPSDLVVVLDKISDPGNIGTIIRTCHWFGINEVFCVKGTADIYNAKCIQSTMGSISGVKVTYGEEDEIYERLKDDHELWIADMEGKDAFKIKVPQGRHALILGSESHGPSDYWKDLAQKVTIPSRVKAGHIDSLNVAQAAAIIISRFVLSA